MKALLLFIPFLASPCAFSACEIEKGNAGGINPLILHFAPGQTRVEQWDFTDCWFGIQNFTLHVLPPHNIKDSLFTVTATNLTTGEVGVDWLDPLNQYFQYADCSVMELTITLSSASKKSADVQVQYSAAFGNLPQCP